MTQDSRVWLSLVERPGDLCSAEASDDPRWLEQETRSPGPGEKESVRRKSWVEVQQYGLPMFPRAGS